MLPKSPIHKEECWEHMLHRP